MSSILYFGRSKISAGIYLMVARVNNLSLPNTNSTCHEKGSDFVFVTKQN